MVRKKKILQCSVCCMVFCFYVIFNSILMQFIYLTPIHSTYCLKAMYPSFFTSWVLSHFLLRLSSTPLPFFFFILSFFFLSFFLSTLFLVLYVQIISSFPSLYHTSLNSFLVSLLLSFLVFFFLCYLSITLSSLLLCILPLPGFGYILRNICRNICQVVSVTVML